MVLPDSHKISRVPWYLGVQTRRLFPFVYGAVTLCGMIFQTFLLENNFVTPAPNRSLMMPDPTTPERQCLRAITSCRFRLIPVRSPLLGESLLLSVPRGTKMVQFPRLPDMPYVFRHIRRINPSGFPIRESPDYHVFAVTRSLSQLATPFIVSWRQGIHRLPLLA